MAEFVELPQRRLEALGDEELVDYLRRARAVGRHDAMKLAVGVLVYGYWDNLVNRARLKLSSGADAQDVAGEAVASAIVSAFDGKSVGEFRSWLHTILSRRIADFYEAKERKLDKTPLPSEHQGDEEVWGREPSVEFEGEALYARDCIRRAFNEIEDPRHRQVIKLYVFGAHSAAETADLVGDGMTEANVHQISSRFQRRARELIEGGDTSD